jgi:hypothetical protein
MLAMSAPGPPIDSSHTVNAATATAGSAHARSSSQRVNANGRVLA